MVQYHVALTFVASLSPESPRFTNRVVRMSLVVMLHSVFPVPETWSCREGYAELYLVIVFFFFVFMGRARHFIWGGRPLATMFDVPQNVVTIFLHHPWYRSVPPIVIGSQLPIGLCAGWLK